MFNILSTKVKMDVNHFEHINQKLKKKKNQKRP